MNLFIEEAVSDTIVDYGGHSWTFPRYLLNTMASIDPPSLQIPKIFILVQLLI